MNISECILRSVTVLCGGGLVATQCIFNLEGLGEPDAFTGIWLAAVVVPVAMAVAVPAVERCLTERLFVLAALISLALACGVSHTAIVAVERSAHTRDTQAASKSNHSYNFTREALDRATVRVQEIRAEVAQQQQTGCGPLCKKAQADLSAAQARVVELEGKLAEIGAPVNEHSMAGRYGAAAEFIDKWSPLLLPLALELAGLGLIGFGLRRGRPRPAPTPEVKARKPSKSGDDKGFTPQLIDMDNLKREKAKNLVPGAVLAKFKVR